MIVSTFLIRQETSLPSQAQYDSIGQSYPLKKVAIKIVRMGSTVDKFIIAIHYSPVNRNKCSAATSPI